MHAQRCSSHRHPARTSGPSCPPRRHVGIRVFRSIGAVRQAGLSAAQHTNAFDAQHDTRLLQGLNEFGVDPGGPAERVDLDGICGVRSGESIDIALVQRFYPWA